MGQKRANSGTGRRWGDAGLAAVVLGVASTSTSAADEPHKANEPAVLSEPSEVMQVVDAFDEYDPFDVSLTVGFAQTVKSARIRRESFIAQPGLTTGNYVSDTLGVARVTERRSRLNTRIDVGLYRDIGIFFRMPIILSDTRRLEGLDGSETQQPLVLRGEPGEQLFQLPFKSPTRSGIEYLAFGLKFAVMNQARKPQYPTWIGGIETRVSVGEPLHACNASPSNVNQTTDPDGGELAQVDCAHPSDYNRNGVGDDISVMEGGTLVPLEGNRSGSRAPGVSRGTTGLQLYSLVSKRVKYVEPYGGFRALFEFPLEKSDFGLTNLEGSLVNHPPLRGTMIAGLAIIPWEIREQFERVTFDIRFEGTYVSEGRDYSELFDALGSSDARSLRRPNYANYQRNPDTASYSDAPSVVNPNSQRVYFTGITDVQQHAEGQLSGQVTWQAGEYVKFNLGTGYSFLQAHFITYDQACNPDFSGSLDEAGPCRTDDTVQVGSYTATGIPNPNYRRTLNSPGYRFKVEGLKQFDGWFNVSVLF